MPGFADVSGSAPAMLAPTPAATETPAAMATSVTNVFTRRVTVMRSSPESVVRVPTSLRVWICGTERTAKAVGRFVPLFLPQGNVPWGSSVDVEWRGIWFVQRFADMARFCRDLTAKSGIGAVTDVVDAAVYGERTGEPEDMGGITARCSAGPGGR